MNPSVPGLRAPEQPAVPRRWYRWLLAALIFFWAAMFIGTHVPMEPVVDAGPQGDKFLHLGGFICLSVLLAATIGSRRVLTLGACLKIVAALALYALFDETTQPLFGRDCEALDWVADVVGALLGTGAVWGLFALLRRGAGRAQKMPAAQVE